MARRLLQMVIALALAAPSAAAAAERRLQFRSAELPLLQSDKDLCAAAGIGANVALAGGLWAYRLRDGTVAREAERIGRATACVRLTNLAFPAGLQQNFYARLSLPDGEYTAVGSCTVISNDVPVGMLVLAGCSLRLVAFPDGVVGGAVTTLSTFNPFHLPGFTTGSYWTVQLYENAEPGEQSDSDEAMHWMDDAKEEPR